jgi:hypothetical protein
LHINADYQTFQEGNFYGHSQALLYNDRTTQAEEYISQAVESNITSHSALGEISLPDKRSRQLFKIKKRSCATLAVCVPSCADKSDMRVASTTGSVRLAAWTCQALRNIAPLAES